MKEEQKTLDNIANKVRASLPESNLDSLYSITLLAFSRSKINLEQERQDELFLVIAKLFDQKTKLDRKLHIKYRGANQRNKNLRQGIVTGDNWFKRLQYKIKTKKLDNFGGELGKNVQWSHVSRNTVLKVILLISVVVILLILVAGTLLISVGLFIEFGFPNHPILRGLKNYLDLGLTFT
jgi:hypothetical protein